LEKVNTALRQQLHEKSRNPDPTAAIIESQSIKGTPESCLESWNQGSMEASSLKEEKEIFLSIQ